MSLIGVIIASRAVALPKPVVAVHVAIVPPKINTTKLHPIVTLVMPVAVPVLKPQLLQVTPAVVSSPLLKNVAQPIKKIGVFKAGVTLPKPLPIVVVRTNDRGFHLSLSVMRL